MQQIIRIMVTAEDVAREAAEEFVRLAKESVAERGRFAVALSGGSTPKLLYSMLADDPVLRAELPWDKTHFFWGDERYVPPDDKDSNYRMTSEAMLSKAPVPASNVHRVKGELEDACKAASEYEETLQEFFGSALPRFDLVLLGMGPDGHTASLFPGTEALGERTHWVVANWVPKFNSFRITLTLPVLNNAACVIFLVGGSEKANVLSAVLGNNPASDPYPAQLVKPSNGKLIWLVAKDAATLLPAN